MFLRCQSGRMASTDMSAVVPVQYLADMVVLVSDAASGEPVLAVIIEPQLRDSETKRYSWPVYVTTARRVLDAMASAEVNDADRLRMTAIILRLASDAARQILEAMMTTSEYEKTFVERIHDQGIIEGEAKGKAEGKAEDILKLLVARHLAPSQEQRQRVTSCTDSAQLDLWFDRAITATTAAEVFTD
jgi:predicted transposase YdaD